jgi:hypothetical protein
MDFDLFNHPSGYFRPILVRFSRFFTPLRSFFDHLSRILAHLTTYGAFSDMSLGKIYIFDVKISKIKRNGQKKG